MSTSLANLVSKTAPLLGAVLGGPAGGLVGTLVSDLFGGSNDDTAALIAKIVNDPDSATKLLQLQSDNKLELQKLALQQELARIDADQKAQALAISDVEDARKAALERIKLQGSDKVLTSIAVIVVVQFFLIIIVLIFFGIKTENKEYFYMLAGQLAGAFTTIVTYYFGSAYQQRKA